MLREVIEQLRAGWLAAVDALERVETIEDQVTRPKADDVPELARQSRLATVLYRNTRELLNGVAGEAAARMDGIVTDLAIVGWKNNDDRQKQMRQALDDYLFELCEEHELELDLEKIDTVIDVVMERAQAVLP
jgi:hypothetical protein